MYSGTEAAGSATIDRDGDDALLGDYDGYDDADDEGEEEEDDDPLMDEGEFSSSLFPYDRYLDSDLWTCVALPMPNKFEGSLTALVSEINFVSRMGPDELAGLKRTDNGLYVKCIRWDAMMQAPVHWTQEGTLHSDTHLGLEETQHPVPAYDSLRRWMHDAVAHWPRYAPERDLAEQAERWRQWEDDARGRARQWIALQRQLMSHFKFVGHPLLYEGLATNEMHFPHGVSWTSGDRVRTFRADSWRAEVHMTHVQAALISLKAGLRRAGRFLFFNVRDASEQADYESSPSMGPGDAPPTYGRGSWDAALEKAEACFAEGFAVLMSLQDLQRGWDFVSTSPQLSSYPIYELRPGFHLGVMNLCQALMQRCAYLRNYLWPAMARAVRNYRQRWEEAKRNQGMVPGQDELCAAFASGTATDKDFWLELEDPEFNVRCVGCAAQTEECFGAAAYQFRLCYLPDASDLGPGTGAQAHSSASAAGSSLLMGALALDTPVPMSYHPHHQASADSLPLDDEEDTSPLLDLAETLHGLQRGTLLFHMAILLAKQPRLAAELGASGLEYDELFRVLLNVSIVREFMEPANAAAAAAALADDGQRVQGAPNAAVADSSLSRRILSCPMFAYDLATRAAHLTSLHLTHAMRSCLLRTQRPPAWKVALRGEVISLHMRELGRINRRLETLMTERRPLIDQELEKLRCCSTINFLPLWQNLLLCCIANELLHRYLQVKSPHDWALTEDKDILRGAISSYISAPSTTASSSGKHQQRKQLGVGASEMPPPTVRELDGPPSRGLLTKASRRRRPGN